MEGEVRRAMSLSPKLEGFARTLLARIQDLRTLPNETIKHDAAATAVRHFDQPSNGWLAAESASFIVFHNQKRELAEKTIQVAERTRAIMQQKWFSEPGPEWNPKCEIYLYGTGQEYSQATSVPANSPGHSDMRSDNTRVLSRRIYLHCDDPSMIVAVLPHETTHVVLAGRFGEFQVPRWADEGVAVLSEPREKIERHLRNLPQFRQDQQLFGVKQLLTLNDYPDPRYIGPFYAQSVSVVEFLSREKGTQTFTLFLRDGLRRGYEAALREHYGFQDFNEFEQRWRRYAFNLTSAGLAEKGRQ